MSKKFNKAVASTVACLVVASVVQMPAFAASTTTTLGGSSRIDTAIKIAEASWTGAWKGQTTAVLTSSADANLVDALAVAPLAFQEKAPILLTEAGDVVNPDVMAELAKNKVTKVYLTAGTGVLTAKMEEQLKAAKIEVVRLGGADRFATAKNIGEKLTKIDGVAVVNAYSTIDALSIAAMAAANNLQIVMTEKDSTPTVKAGVPVVVVGGSGVVSDKVVTELKATRLGGDSRYTTNANVIAGADKLKMVDYKTVYVADGSDAGVDALAGSVLAAQTKSPIFIADKAGSLVSAQTDVLKAHKASEVNVTKLGGQVTLDSTVKVVTAAVTETSGTMNVKSASAVTDKKVNVNLTDKMSGSVAASKFVVKDSKGTVVEVTDAVLSADGMTVKLTTAAQTANTLYTLTVDGKEFKYVAMAADTVAPKLLSAVATTNTEVKVVFDSNVDDNALSVGNYTIAGLSVLKAAYELDADGNEIKTNVVLTTVSQTSGTIYKVVVANVTDMAGNVINSDNKEFQFGGLPVDTTKPEVSSAVAINNTKVKVNYSEAVDMETATNIANYKITGLSIVKAELSKDKMYVTLTTASQTVGSIYKVEVSNVKDVTGNVLNADKSTFQFGGLAVDTTKPELSSAVATTNTSVKVSFNETIDKESATNISNYAIAGLSVTKAELSDDAMSVTLTTAAQTVGTIYKVVVTNVKDESGNLVNTDKNSFQFGGLSADTTKPTVVGAISTSTTSVKVTFSESISDASGALAYNYYFGAELGYATKAVKDATVTDGTQWVLTTATQSKKVYTLDVTGVQDLSGNVLDEDKDEASFAGNATADTTAPKVASAVATDNNTIVVKFNEDMDKATIATTDFAITVSTGAEVSRTSPATIFAGQTAIAVKVDDDKKTVTLQFANAVQTPGVVYKVVASTVNDASGNAISTTDNFALFAGSSLVNAAPKVVSSVCVDNQTLKINFSEPVTLPAALTSANVTITPGTGAPAFTGVFQKAVLSSDKMSVTVYYASQVSPATAATTDMFKAGSLYSVNITTASVKDALGVATLSTATDENKGTFAGVTNGIVSPKIASIVAVDKNTFDITFNQVVNSTLVMASIGVTNNASGVSVPVAVALVRAEGDAGNKVRVFLNDSTATSALASGAVYKVTLDNTKVVNANGTFMAVADNNAVFAAISTSNAAPKFATVTAASATTVKVVFSEKITGLQANGADFDINGMTIDKAEIGTDGKTVTITTTANLTGIKTLSIKSTSTIKDEASVGSVDTSSKMDFAN